MRVSGARCYGCVGVSGGHKRGVRSHPSVRLQRPESNKHTPEEKVQREDTTEQKYDNTTSCSDPLCARVQHRVSVPGAGARVARVSPALCGGRGGGPLLPPLLPPRPLLPPAPPHRAHLAARGLHPPRDLWPRHPRHHQLRNHPQRQALRLLAGLQADHKVQDMSCVLMLKCWTGRRCPID